MNGAGLRILFVEDDPDQSFLWLQRLRNSGHQVTHATNGAEAIEAAATAQFGCVLMDICLGPGTGGIEAAARLRVLQPSLPLIFMTAHDDGATLEDAKLAMPAGYLHKPFTYRDLLAAIEKGTCSAMPELSNDHDLLVRLDVKLDLVSVQLNEARVLVAAKADRETLEPRFVKIEKDLDECRKKQEWTTNRMYMIVGGLVVLEVLLKLVHL